MRVRVLGPVGIWAGDEELSAVPAGKPRGLLAVLALAGGRAVPVGQLLDALWGDDPPLTSAKTLQVHVSTLRARLRPLGANVLLSAAGYRLDVPADAIDVTQFELLAERGLAALAEDRPDVASRVLQAALDEWSGDPLAGVDAPFAAHEVIRLELRRLAVVQARVEADLALGLGATMVEDLRAVAAAHPYDERACRQLMAALYRAGQPAAALESYRSFRGRLGEELGLEVGPALADMERQVLTHDDRLLARRIGSSARRSNLPQPLSVFVGRDEEKRAVADLVRRSRVVTVTGAGGAGKTRLSLTVAAELVEEMADGAWFVELSSLASGEVLGAAVAHVLGSSPDEGTAGVVEFIGGRQVLLVLDNCEHVVAATADLVADLLMRCPALRVLATSREPLGLDGERTYRVPPLALPPLGESGAAAVAASDSVRLLIDRARSHRPEFAVDDDNAAAIAMICRQLDGLPLAIELAAARLRTMGVADLARRLDQRLGLLQGAGRHLSPRQRTLRGLIDWSYDLLSGAERVVLQRLAIFVGSFDLDAAESVCGAVAAAHDSDVLEVLTALVDKSLVEVSHQDSTRFRLLETIRQYAAERLDAEGADVVSATRSDHARHYLDVAAAAAPWLQRSGALDAVSVLNAEHGNLQATAKTLLDDPDRGSHGLELVMHLHRWWELEGLCSEGAELAAAFVALATVQDHVVVLALCVQVDMLERLGDLEAASTVAARALDLATALDDAGLRFEASLRTSLVAARRGELDAALEALAVPDELDDGQVMELNRVRAFVYLYLDDMAGARAALGAAEGAARRLSNTRRLASFLSNLSVVDLADGDLAAAAEHLAEAQTLAARVGDRVTVLYATLNLGIAAILAEDLVTAQVRYREALLQNALGTDPVAMTSCLLGLSVCWRAGGDAVSAAMLHGFVDESVQRSATNLDPTETGLVAKERSRLSEMIGPSRLAELLATGRQFGVDEAVEFARRRGVAGLDAASSTGPGSSLAST